MKKKISVSIDEDLLAWVDAEIEKKTFASISHAINLSLNELKKSMKKK
jgi:Arc/MetJ-type ribon-helix-helix transcriptional regulator